MNYLGIPLPSQSGGGVPGWVWLVVWFLAICLFCLGWYAFNKPLRDDEDQLRKLFMKEKENGRVGDRPRRGPGNGDSWR